LICKKCGICGHSLKLKQILNRKEYCEGMPMQDDVKPIFCQGSGTIPYVEPNESFKVIY